MRKVTVWAAGCVVLAGGMSWGGDPTPPGRSGSSRKPTTRSAPASRPTPTSAPSTRPARRFDYVPATPEQIEANRKLTEEWAKKVRETIAPKLRRLETKHFVIYTSWPRDGDRPIKGFAEKIYRRLCRQFDIPPQEMIWAGKCPIFTFMKEEEYTQFVSQIDKTGHSAAAGYCAYRRNEFCYIVMKRPRSIAGFNTVLAHEATHGFIHRCIGPRKLPEWVNEGLAEYIAATVVPGGFARRRFVRAGREAIRTKRDIMPVFKEVTLDSFDYGIAQSLVRVLISKSKRGFIKFLDLLRQGKGEEAAMKEAFGWTREDLVKAWSKAVRVNY